MARASVTNVPDDHHILRYASPVRLRRDAANNVIGVLAAAFQLRPGEAYLSAGWLDMYGGNRDERLRQAAAAYDASPLHIKPNGAFAVGQVSAIKTAGERFKQKFRIVHEPSKGLGSYVAVRQYRDDEAELLALLADDAWAECVTVAACKA